MISLFASIASKLNVMTAKYHTAALDFCMSLQSGGMGGGSTCSAEVDQIWLG